MAQDQFPVWRAQLGLDGVSQDMPGITRGLAHSVIVALFGDFSADTFTMQLRAAPDAATALATFTCTTGAFISGVTEITLSLAADAQTGLPVDGDKDGVETLVYDLICSPAAGEPYRMLAGYQPVSGAVTA